MLKLTDKPWYETDTYYIEDAPLPLQLADYAGPKGVALVRAYESGATQDGWGLTGKKDDDGNKTDGFMPRYLRTEFAERRALYGYNKGKHEFAIVMRSLRLGVIDIDGKNGGLEGVKQLGPMPLTLAEVSKSQNGFHLFMSVDDMWDDELGYGGLPDAIGIAPGVDIRIVGCVYHFHGQKWNDRPIAPMPEHLQQLLRDKQVAKAAAAAELSNISSLDPTDQLLLHASLLDELKKPIPAGRRNTTLFALGGKFRAAGVPMWEEAIRDRARSIKLDADEIEKLIHNIKNYG